MLCGGPINRQRNNNFKKARTRRLEKLKDFPIGTLIAYSFDKSVLLGKVLEHNLDLGRLVTGKDCSHDPTEVVVFQEVVG